MSSTLAYASVSTLSSHLQEVSFAERKIVIRMGARVDLKRMCRNWLLHARHALRTPRSSERSTRCWPNAAEVQGRDSYFRVTPYSDPQTRSTHTPRSRAVGLENRLSEANAIISSTLSHWLRPVSRRRSRWQPVVFDGVPGGCDKARPHRSGA